MMSEECRSRFFKAVAYSLGIEPSTLTINLAKDDIPEWDSLGHLKLLLGIEDEFGISFSMEETEKLFSLADICNLIEIKITP